MKLNLKKLQTIQLQVTLQDEVTLILNNKTGIEGSYDSTKIDLTPVKKLTAKNGPHFISSSDRFASERRKTFISYREDAPIQFYTGNSMINTTKGIKGSGCFFDVALYEDMALVLVNYRNVAGTHTQTFNVALSKVTTAKHGATTYTHSVKNTKKTYDGMTAKPYVKEVVVETLTDELTKLLCRVADDIALGNTEALQVIECFMSAYNNESKETEIDSLLDEEDSTEKCDESQEVNDKEENDKEEEMIVFMEEIKQEDPQLDSELLEVALESAPKATFTRPAVSTFLEDEDMDFYEPKPTIKLVNTAFEDHELAKYAKDKWLVEQKENGFDAFEQEVNDEYAVMIAAREEANSSWNYLNHSDNRYGSANYY